MRLHTTPGPWRVDGDGTPMETPGIFAGTAAEPKVIAWLVYSYETEGWTPNNEADAHLIADVPEFLTAAADAAVELRRLYGVIDSLGDFLNRLYKDVGLPPVSYFPREELLLDRLDALVEGQVVPS